MSHLFIPLCYCMICHLVPRSVSLADGIYVSFRMRPAPPGPSTGGRRSLGPWLPFARFTVAVATVRGVKDQEQQCLQSGGVRDPRWLWESPRLPCFLKTLWIGPAQREIPGSGRGHAGMKQLKTQKFRPENHWMWHSFSNHVSQSWGRWGDWGDVEPGRAWVSPPLPFLSVL